MSDDLHAFRRNVVLLASAGTGKTHALVGVLLHALLGVSELARGPVDPARIAATTFSRKAAAEIRERLVVELERLAFGASSAYASHLEAAARRLGVEWGSGVCAERARRTLAVVDHAMITTLHGLAYSVARTHALAVGLAPSLEVASEDDNEAWADEAVAAALNEHARRDADAVRDLFRLLRGGDRAQAELVRLLLSLDDDGRPASSLALPEGDLDALEAAMRTIASISTDVRAAHAAVEKSGLRELPTLVAAVGELFARRGVDDRPWRAIREGLSGASHRARAEELVHAWAARARIIPTAALIRTVLSSAQAHLATLHAHAGAVGFGAVLRLARDALRDDPIAAARTAAAWDALLVDEFQDTSRVQVELLRLLWERAPRARAPGAMPIFGDLRPTGLLVVGDRKQSIYAFRGADVGVFVTTCIEIAGEKARVALGVAEGLVPAPSRTTGDFFALRENHRANAELIDLVNAFSRECLQAESDELFEARYVEEVESLLPAPTTHRGSSTSERRVVWLHPAGEPRDTTRLEDATLAATFISESVGRERADDGSPLTFRDFALLAQSGAMLDAAAFAMSRIGIPHVIAGRGFFATREVQDLLALLRFIDRPEDRAALLCVLRGPFAALSDRTLLGLTEAHRGLVTAMDRWDTLERRVLVEDDDREALGRARTTLLALRRSAERLGPGPTLREAVRAFEIEQTLLLLPRGAQRLANVRKLLRIADGEPTLRALLERVARAEARAREPEAATFSEDDDAVRLLTLHASKGLGFRVVLVPELRGAPIRSQSATLGVDLHTERAWIATKLLDDRGEPVGTPSLRQLTQDDRARLRADRRRLMYVAVTRARERLVFIGGLKATSRAQPHFGAIVATLARSGAIEKREGDTTARAVMAPPSEALDVTLAPPIEPRAVAVGLAPTALQDFRHCARRFELVHVVGLPEPTPHALGRFRADGAAEQNARAEGTALHAVLERIDARALGAPDAEAMARSALASSNVALGAAAVERVIRAATRFLGSEYARSLHRASEIWRERSFVMTLTSDAMTLTLRGAMDLVALWPNGDIDVVDYKSSRGPDSRPHALQLDVYALAAARLAPGRVRVGAMFLGGDLPEARFRPPIKRAALEAELLELAGALASARSASRYPRAAPKTCHAIGCGYFTLCHPPQEKRQLTLFR